jgi:nicotinamide-nucleotide amidase
MRIELLSIGNELLSGRTLDTNFAWLARALERVNVRIGWHQTLPDERDAIAGALRVALGRADAIVMTGGLGPTPDDLTREAIAGALGLTLERDESVIASIRERARRMKRTLPKMVEVQALVPRGAEVLPNALGTAPGLCLTHEGHAIYLLPGVPHEMEALATEFVVPRLAQASGGAVATITLRTAGTFETKLQQMLGERPAAWPGATLAYLPGTQGVDLRVTVVGDDVKDVAATAARARADIEAAVGAVIYAEGDRTMEQVLGALLVDRQWTLAVAESCTGGLIAKRVTDVAGSSKWFERGYVTYSNRAKVELLGVSEAALAAHGAVSVEVGEAMARGARERAGADVGIGITGVAGPDGGTATKPVGYVCFCVTTGDGTVLARDPVLPGRRADVRERSVDVGMHLLLRAVRP